MEAAEFLNGVDRVPYESISALDRPHRFVTSGIWEIPVVEDAHSDRSFRFSWMCSPAADN
jgi:hypothetical protein